jgi:hypothetical protein
VTAVLDLFACPPDQVPLSGPVPAVDDQADGAAAGARLGGLVGAEDRGADVAVQSVDVKSRGDQTSSWVGAQSSRRSSLSARRSRGSIMRGRS